MGDARIAIMPLAAAVAALSPALATTQAQASGSSETIEASQLPSATLSEPANTIVSTGRDLLGFVVNERADGTVVAYHSSHASHASHASHYSSR